MEEAEQSRYVAQLKAEFDSCDATSSGFLGPQEVTALCGKLHLDVQLPLVLDSLLGGGAYARVDFEAFKDNFVDVLSRSLDLTADDDSRCQQPVVADEVKPKFVKGGKRYGRRSRPDIKPSRPSDDSPPPPPCTGDTVRSSPGGARGPKVRRSTCPDSVELSRSNYFCGPRGHRVGEPRSEVCPPDGRTRDEHVVYCVQSPKSDEEAGSPEDGASVRFRSKASEPEEEESARDGPVGRRPGAQERGKSEQVAPGHFQNLLCGCAPVCCSTPRKTAPEDGPTTVTAGPEVLSRLDDGSGRASPERVVALWAEEGVRDGRDVLRTLDFPAEERVSLRELTSALDNELAVSGNRIHRAALICYKNEIRHLRARAEQARGERDKAGADLERAERRNLRLVREADERHAGMEELHRTGIRKLERDFRERLAAQRGQAEQESADAVQQLEQERQKLQRQLTMLRAQEAGLQEELGGAAQENRRLREELVDVRRRLNEAESGARRLHADFNRLLHHKWSSSDAVDSAEDELARLLRDYEHRCRELRDKNDELSSELELMRSHEKSDRKSPHAAAAAAELCWSEAPSASELDSDDCDTMRRLSAARPDDATAAVSVETELAVEKLKSEHEREMRRLDIQTETQVNYYKCGLDRMRQSMEAERQDMAQAFKLEISELEDQKAEAERQAELLKEALDKLHNQIQHGGRSAEEERRMRRERADSERNFAREMGNLVRRLNAEKEQLEAELKLKMDREVMVVSGGLKSRCGSARGEEEAAPPKVSVASSARGACGGPGGGGWNGSDRNGRGWSGRRKRWRKRNISRRKRGGRSRRRVSRGSRCAPYSPEEVRPEENVFDREGTAASGGSAPLRTGGYTKMADQLSARIVEMANAVSGPLSGTSGR
ncbi:ninein-like protein isoform X3 [Phyllopteryx taeniolatus]|uniref:ninein-like protein isoform X3 n=1 Tax=Phyllopteryx taeniolatus TaxID=161469 RepID=UPI002AD2862E|nr:ninein-like protein isoform X3 [Phyllopteryx taeniolatus]